MSRERAARLLTIGAVVLVGLAAAQPLVTSGGRLPWAADTLLHLYRLVEFDHLIQHGYLLPRYAPDLAYGFGFPLFNFYAPLSYYAAELFKLIGFDFSPALLLTFTAFIVLAGWGMYGWASTVWGKRAGIVAAAAYVTAPYLLYNVYHRSALAEVLAMALMPALLWAVTRLATTGAPRHFALTALLYAALMLGHNITALVLTPIIIVYAAMLTWHASHQAMDVSRFAFYAVRLAPLALGLGLSTFFWLPAFLERNSVQIFQLFLPEGFDYHFNFISLAELFAPPATVDPRLVLQPTSRSIGLIPLIVAILAVAFGWKRWGGQQRLVAAFAATLALGFMFLTLPQSVAIWDALPILRFVQFPWRFLSFASLGLAFLAGGLFADSSLPSHQDTKTLRQLEPWFMCPLVIGMIVYGFTWQYAPFLAPVTQPQVADIAHYERESGALGTTSAGDYLPNTVKQLPDARTLTERYSRSNVIERLDLASLPSGAQVLTASYRPLSSDVTIDSPVPFNATFDFFYFAGWQASVDGQPIAITPTDPHGLIRFPVPAGQHRINVWFGSTPLRTATELISLANALALIVASVWLARRTSTIAHPTDLQTVSGHLAVLLLASCALLIIAKSLYLDRHETIFRRTRFDGQRVTGIAHPLNVNFEGQMALMGYEPATLSAETNHTVRVTLYWRTLQKLKDDYSISAQLVDERGLVYGQRDSQHPGGYPTSRWTASDYARDVHEIALAPGTPPGEYRLRVSVYRVGAASGLSILDANGAPAGTSYDVATVVVKRAGQLAWLRPKPATPRPTHIADVMLAPNLKFIGYDWPQAEVDAGARFSFTLYWLASQTQTRDLKARLQLIDVDGVSVFSTTVAPISPQFPTSRIQANDVLRAPNVIRIPASTPSGRYALDLLLVNESGAVMGDKITFGRVTVRVPPRVMTPPRVEHPQQVELGGQVRLIGYDLKPRTLNVNSQIEIVVYWQALREITSDDKSFVHLLDSTGRLVAGSDAVPASWTRPTTGWVTGEYVADPHTLTLPDNLPPGEYRIEVGIYDAETNLRLGTSILLDQRIVIAP